MCVHWEPSEQILMEHISGYHRYRLTPPAGLIFVSDNLCRMLGCTREDLTEKPEDPYLRRICPAHRQRYAAALDALAQEETTLTISYRLQADGGRELYVSDSLCSSRLSDGTMVCDSVLSDVTELQKQQENLQYLNDTAPCGFIKYTCQPQPQVTYLNRQMKEILGIPEQGDPAALYQGSLYLMIPPEERTRVAGYLERVYTQGVPIAGELTVLRWDGTKAHLFGWVTKTVNAQGQEEFQSVCMDVTDRYQAKLLQQTQRYLKALTDVYDMIFAFDRSNGSVNCLHSGGSPAFSHLENIPMPMQEGADRWIRETVFPEDQPRVQSFFQDFFRRGQEDAQPARISYLALNRQGAYARYNGIFLKMADAVSWFCCRRLQEEMDQLRSENSSLKENMQELILRFTDGLAAFELRGDQVKPLYASDNVCEFFGFDREEWLAMMRQGAPIQKFIARSETSYGEFMALLENGEGEFTYFDLKTRTKRRIKAICSQKSPGSCPVRYVMLYNLDHAPAGEPGPGEVYIRTFGYFDVFVGDKPIAFRNKKSKELLALLVDRRGGYVSSEEAISFLWEDEPASPVTLARYRKVALRLKNILEEYGISYIVESVDGKRRIAPEKLRCDLYDYLTGQEAFAGLFKGSYLTNYSWAEATLASLTGRFLE